MELNFKEIKRDNGDIMYIIFGDNDTFLAECHIAIYDKTSKNKSFVILDIFGIERVDISKIIQIHSIFVNREFRKHGYLKKLIDYIANIYKEYPIITVAALSTIEYPEDEYYDPDDGGLTEKDKIGLEPLNWDELPVIVNILKKVGFRSINNYINYEYQDAMLYTKNEPGDQLYNVIKEGLKNDKY